MDSADLALLSQSAEVYRSLMPAAKTPAAIFGLWQIDEEKMYEVVSNALKVGYRAFDTAYEYKNEAAFGAALSRCLAEQGITRDEIWVQTKLWCTHHRPELVLPALKQSLTNLGLSYVDSYLIHWPLAFVPPKETFSLNDEDLYPRIAGHIQLEHVPMAATLAATTAAAAAAAGAPVSALARSVGVSNCTVSLLHELLSSGLRISTNQIELHAALRQPALVAYCWRHGISVQAYSPTGGAYGYGQHGGVRLHANPTLLEVAGTRSLAPHAQLLRWHARYLMLCPGGYGVVSRSTDATHMAANRVSITAQVDAEELDAIEEAFPTPIRFNDAAKVFWETPTFE